MASGVGDDVTKMPSWGCRVSGNSSLNYSCISASFFSLIFAKLQYIGRIKSSLRFELKVLRNIIWVRKEESTS